MTGWARGIGFSTAQALAEAGACVTISDLTEQGVARACRELSSAGHYVAGEVMDVTDSVEVSRVTDGLVARHGRIVLPDGGHTCW